MPDAGIMVTPTVTGWLLTYLLHSTVLLAGAGVVGWWMVRVPAQRDALGKATVLGAVITATLAWSTPGPVGTLRVVSARTEVVQTLDPATLGDPATLVDAAATVVTARSEVVRRRMDSDARIILHEVGSAGGSEAMSPDFAWAGAEAFPAGGLASPPWSNGLLAVWMVGALVGLVRLSRGRAAVSTIRTSLTACSPRVLRLLSGVVGLGRLRIRSSHAIETPCVLPGGVVVVSGRAERQLDDRALTAVLAHEVGHVVRRDPSWFLVLDVVSAILWVQPLNRLMVASLRANAELVCDDWAVERTGRAAELARTIADVAEWGVVAPTVGAMSMTRPGQGAAARVERLLADERSRPERIWSALAVAVILVASAFQLPAVQMPGEIHAAFIEAEGVSDLIVREFVQSPGEDGRMRRAKIVIRSLEDG